MAKIEVANTLFLVCFETIFVSPEHCAFCLCEVLARCHRYGISLLNLYARLCERSTVSIKIIVCLQLHMTCTCVFTDYKSVVWSAYCSSSVLI